MKDQAKAQVITLMRKMLDKNTENKEIGFNVEATTHNSAITNADLVPIIPEIASGTDSQTRLGDRVKPTSLIVKGVVSMADNPDTKPLYVRVLILSQKDVKVGSAVGTATDPAHLLRPAIAGAPEVAWTGTRPELNYFVNDNKFKVYMDKKFLLTPSSSASGVPQVGSQFTFQKKFKSLPAHLSFDEGNGDWPNNFAPFFAIGYCYADGSAPDTVATRISTNIYSRLTYEDA